MHLIHGDPALAVSCHLLMDCAHEGNETRRLALDLGFIPVVPPHPNRVESWKLKKLRYRRRNEIERLFRQLKGFRRIFSRFDKLDLVIIAFVYFALIVEHYGSRVNTPWGVTTRRAVTPGRGTGSPGRHRGARMPAVIRGRGTRSRIPLRPDAVRGIRASCRSRDTGRE